MLKREAEQQIVSLLYRWELRLREVQESYKMGQRVRHKNLGHLNPSLVPQPPKPVLLFYTLF